MKSMNILSFIVLVTFVFVLTTTTPNQMCVVASSSASTTTTTRIPLTPNIGTKIHSLYFAPVKYNHTLIGPFNTYSNTEVGYFYIAQWSNPSPIINTYYKLTPPDPECFFHSSSSEPSSTSPFPFTQSYTPLWSIQNENLRVCALKNHENPDGLLQVQLSTNGGSNLECGKEFDLFLSPNDLKTYPYNNQPGNQNVNHATLTEIHGLDISFGIDLIFNQVRRRCASSPFDDGCGPAGKLDYGYITLGLPLSNPISKQTIFFQILLFDTRENNRNCTKEFSTVCSPNPNAQGSWYFKTLPTLGVNFNIGTFLSSSENCISTSNNNNIKNVWYNSSTFNMHRLWTSIQQSVKEASEMFGADGDLTNWEIGSWYLGMGSQGDVAMTSVVSFEKFEGLA